MRHYLSFGGGVNSTALMLLLRDEAVDFEAVYADHGADWPETREYVTMLQGIGYPITILETRRNGLALYEYYEHHRMVPLRVVRACTVEYKLVPLVNYMPTPCVVYIGIDDGEQHRANRIVAGQRPGEEKRFPLIERGIDRQGCIDIITAHGLTIPRKSGCFICPFQRRSQWRELRTIHPDLYCRAKRLEDANIARLRERGQAPMYMADKPLDMLAEADQIDLWGERDMRPCLCEL